MYFDYLVKYLGPLVIRDVFVAWTMRFYNAMTVIVLIFDLYKLDLLFKIILSFNRFSI